MRLREQIVKANLLVREASYIAEELDKRTEYKVTLQIPASSLDANRKVRLPLMEVTKIPPEKTAVSPVLFKHQRVCPPPHLHLLQSASFCTCSLSLVEFTFNSLPLCLCVLCPLAYPLHLFPPHATNLFYSAPFLQSVSMISGTSFLKNLAKWFFAFILLTPYNPPPLSSVFTLRVPCYFHLLIGCSAKLFISCFMCVFMITFFFCIM